ncbi:MULTISPECIES: tRNA dihydrouridine synthase [Thalassospira]|uniref:tRNA-dihydrouridine(16) synthase n=2 Tax=Thalassospira TaxID=168934 RepID=A0A367WCA7_9PROT|nr:MULTISPECIES: tRNA-dihydrouridine synthase [Thalassospira]MDG4717428.1 tRNA-dihydrouridine synthase [Thalassospira sp. FZY0004]RCK39094.1 tRNA-dihydrouridine synthase C [Thalassospira profundimaris]
MTHLVLAPMEGLVDWRVRQLLTATGGFDLCVTEFIRVSQNLFPAHVFHRYCPELLNGGKTLSGVPVLVQLMGHDPELMGENAAFATTLGAPGIDINFGCPSKTVNKREAGASLLKCPDNLFHIVSAVRRAVPADIPVSAKVRLGFSDKELFLDIARAVEAGGAQHLTVHARTKLEGYKPPAHWEYLARIREAISIGMTGNGEIWDVADYEKCRDISGCDSFMIGRGAIAAPDLANRIKASEGGSYLPKESWADVLAMLLAYCDLMETDGASENHQAGRIKQWMALIRKSHAQGAACFDDIKRIRAIGELRAKLQHDMSLPENQRKDMPIAAE